MKKIIIVGGGFAGIKLAKALQKKFSVILIDNKDYFEFTPSVPKVLAHPNHSKKIRKLHKNILDCEIIVGEANIYKNRVIINNKQLLFDYLIIATGSTYNKPFKEKNVLITNRASQLEDNHEQISKAKSISIIGGGIVGIEVAAELKERYPDKEITIIHSQPKLMPRSSSKAIREATSHLERLGVKLILGEKVVTCKKDFCETDKGTKINHELVLMCTGINPNSKLVKISDVKDDRGFLIVNKKLQLKSFKNIFVAGDITNIKEEKTAQNAEEHAKIIIKNISFLESNKKLLTYHNKPNWLVISLGEKSGIITKNNFSHKGIIPSILKKLIERKVMITK